MEAGYQVCYFSIYCDRNKSSTARPSGVQCAKSRYNEWRKAVLVAYSKRFFSQSLRNHLSITSVSRSCTVAQLNVLPNVLPNANILCFVQPICPCGLDDLFSNAICPSLSHGPPAQQPLPNHPPSSTLTRTTWAEATCSVIHRARVKFSLYPICRRHFWLLLQISICRVPSMRYLQFGKALSPELARTARLGPIE